MEPILAGIAYNHKLIRVARLVTIAKIAEIAM
jgi:hypothetical protein